MIRGCLDWQQRKGLQPPQAVTEATAAYLEAEDIFAAWLGDAGTRDANSWERTGRLFASWSAYAVAAGEFPGSEKRFAQNMEKRGFTHERRGKERHRGFRGFHLARGTSHPQAQDRDTKDLTDLAQEII
jgi:putative DNA primase/helicase